MERITTALHKGKAIIQIDFDGCKPGAFAPVIADAQRLIAASPKGSVLALTCLENVRFDPSTVVEMQRFVSAAMPFLKANALVGITGLKKVVFNGIKPLYKIPVELVETRAAGKDWLVER
ncbi:MAG TPA: hypothetical protein VF912_01785 [Anaeromyxobacter sp.]